MDKQVRMDEYGRMRCVGGRMRACQRNNAEGNSVGRRAISVFRRRDQRAYEFLGPRGVGITSGCRFSRRATLLDRPSLHTLDEGKLNRFCGGTGPLEDAGGSRECRPKASLVVGVRGFLCRLFSRFGIGENGPRFIEGRSQTQILPLACHYDETAWTT